MHNSILILTIFIVAIILWIIVTYILKIWPFKKSVSLSKSKSKKILNDISYSYTSDSNVSSFTGILLFVLFILLAAFIAYVSFRTDIARYKIAGDAVKSGNNGIALTALSPEIGRGVNNMFRY